MIKKIISVFDADFMDKLGKVANVVAVLLGAFSVLLTIAHKIVLIRGNKPKQVEDTSNEG